MVSFALEAGINRFRCRAFGNGVDDFQLEIMVEPAGEEDEVRGLPKVAAFGGKGVKDVAEINFFSRRIDEENARLHEDSFAEKIARKP